jgi:hypothetical protein
MDQATRMLPRLQAAVQFRMWYSGRDATPAFVIVNSGHRAAFRDLRRHTVERLRVDLIVGAWESMGVPRPYRARALVRRFPDRSLLALHRTEDEERVWRVDVLDAHGVGRRVMLDRQEALLAGVDRDPASDDWVDAILRLVAWVGIHGDLPPLPAAILPAVLQHPAREVRLAAIGQLTRPLANQHGFE